MVQISGSYNQAGQNHQPFLPNESDIGVPANLTRIMVAGKYRKIKAPCYVSQVGSQRQKSVNGAVGYVRLPNTTVGTSTSVLLKPPEWVLALEGLSFRPASSLLINSANY
jgi:hypothetical protein